jgi:hypothetical protein
MYFLMTNDEESFSIPLSKLDTGTAKEVYELGLPRLLDLYARHDNADKPVVFLFHPNECLNVGDRIAATRRTKNPIEYLFADEMINIRSHRCSVNYDST